MPSNQHLTQGDAAEDLAATLLEKQGLTLIARNYRSKRGELDLVMLDNQHLVIVEVRYRKNSSFGSAAESVNRSKQRRIIAATEQFLNQYKQHAGRAIRFDVVAMQDNQSPEWLKDAFQTC